MHRSLRYGWWSSTQAGNARLYAAFRGLDAGEGESLGDLPKTLDESCGMDDLDRAFIVNAVKEDGDETEVLAPDLSDISRDSEESDSPSPAGPLEASTADAAARPRHLEGPRRDPQGRPVLLGELQRALLRRRGDDRPGGAHRSDRAQGRAPSAPAAAAAAAAVGEGEVLGGSRRRRC